MSYKNWSFFTVLLGCSLFVSCNRQVDPPAPYGPLPTEYQMTWQKMEYNMFVHFGPNTFTNVEWGNGKEDPKVFNPSAIDCRQWAAVAKAAGMKGIIITAKHHDGFCLWPSKYSTHTVRESSWKEGKGDLLRELSDACKEYGLKFGVYLSPWDQNHPAYGTTEYNQVFVNTLTEVLTNYGEVFEQWFDGANGEGHGGKKQVYDWPLFNATVYKYQPQAVIFSDVGPGCRWVGNEQGHVGETNWSRLDVEGYEPGAKGPNPDSLNTGNINGARWLPAETNTSIRPGWFYSPSTDDKVKSLGQLVDIYYTSVGRNSTLLLNVPPDRTGRIHPNDSIRLMELRKAIDESFKTNLAKGTLTATSTRGNDSRYSVTNLLDGDYDTYWATDDDVLTASVELTLDAETTFNRLLLQEYIPLGQRIVAFNVDYWDDATQNWKQLIEATTVGYKRILRFPEVTASRIRIHITRSLACPLLNNLELYNAPDYPLGISDDHRYNLTSREGWKLLSPTVGADKIIDGKADEAVLVNLSEPLILDLGKSQSLTGFYYAPQNKVTAANIQRYRVYTSADNKNWTELKTKGLFNNFRNNPVRQDVDFGQTIQARYFKLEPIELTNTEDSYAVLELGVIQE
ncbi:MAG: alpha-L-fucosidase [Massilibacteroides sp.]|nr:alpha-L-fucosidase [Massilibacteroides sp.]